jgi:hypothetical protein
LFRRLGPLSFITGNDYFPGDQWNLGPFAGCDDAGNGGLVSLPSAVRNGEWILCDPSTCYPLTQP